MAKVERVRELLRETLDPNYVRLRSQAGWKLVAVEWQREVEGELDEEAREDVPYGLRVANDCLHLEEDPEERSVLVLMMDLIIQDHPLSRVADELNRAGFRTRRGSDWSPVAVFNMLPRLIDVGPRIFSREEWAERRDRLMRAV